jgi:poly-gamma-glutamate biosynthesis protein PgsC/CapC
MITEAIFLGILLGFIYYEVVGLTPGGIVVPGYIALYFDKPLILLSTLIAVLVTLVLILGLSRLVILYGRRAFLAAVVIGFILKWSIEILILRTGWASTELVVIGYIVPGLIAHEMRKQGITETILSLVLVSGVVHIILRFRGFGAL